MDASRGFLLDDSRHSKLPSSIHFNSTQCCARHVVLGSTDQTPASKVDTVVVKLRADESVDVLTERVGGSEGSEREEDFISWLWCDFFVCVWSVSLSSSLVFSLLRFQVSPELMLVLL